MKTQFEIDNMHENDMLMRGFSFFDLELDFENENPAFHKGKTKEQILEYCFDRLLKIQRSEAKKMFKKYKDYFFRDESVIDGDVKTLQGWKDSNTERFDEYFPVGCKVSRDVVIEMLEVLPPRTIEYGLMQMGEPVDCKIDPSSGQYRTTYMTFYKKEEQWYYAGNCFPGETINRD